MHFEFDFKGGLDPRIKAAILAQAEERDFVLTIPKGTPLESVGFAAADTMTGIDTEGRTVEFELQFTSEPILTETETHSTYAFRGRLKPKGGF